MTDMILIKYGEIALKGKNRRYFENKLANNIKASLKGVSDASFKMSHGRMFVFHKRPDGPEVIERLRRVFGIVALAPGKKCDNDVDQMIDLAIAEMTRVLRDTPHKTFKVETRRTDKGFPLKSPEISKMVGGALHDHFEALEVDVHHPDITVNIEVREKTYLYTGEIKGLGGMPYGTSGKAVSLLSGGIDSPVASYLVAKRGVTIEAVHYHSYPFTSERAHDKVLTLAKKIAAYTGGRLLLHSINIAEIQQAIAENCPSREITILSRRFMMRLAERVAEEVGGQALVTGENLGQVASQTIEGLGVTNDAVSLPILQPLITFDKSEIIEVAHRIDTFETSILPFEDCCTVFLPDEVVIKPTVEEMHLSEEALKVADLVEKAYAAKEMYRVTPDEVHAL